MTLSSINVSLKRKQATRMDKIAKFALVAKYYYSEEIKETVMAGLVLRCVIPDVC